MPSAFRKPENLPEWIQLDFFRRSRSLGRWKSLLIRLTFLALLAGTAAAYFVPHSSRWLQAGPVSAAHTFINDDCTQCHTEPMQTIKRFLRWDGLVRAVGNKACSQCHEGPAHNEQQLVELDCAACHREHRGRSILARVPDNDCTACHADLKANHAAGDGCRFQDVVSFPDGHPQFALWEGRDPLAPAGKDPGQLHFNHAVHLSANGLLQPNGSRKKLNCVECHQLDEAGRYMRPINYEQHCRTCHPLSVRLAGRFAGTALHQAAEQYAREPAPHKEPAIVRAVLRDRLLGFARKHQLLPGADGHGLTFPKARRPQPGRDLTWIEAGRAVTEMEGALFANAQLEEQERSLFQLSGGCVYCHVAGPSAATAGQAELPSLLATRLRSRWLPHSRFRHTAHRMMPASDRGGPVAPREQEVCSQCHDARASTQTSDILMPRLETCAGCHNASYGARHDCVECHRYHGRGAEPPQRGYD